MSYIVFSVMHFVKTCQNSQNNSCITNYFGSVHLTSSDTSVDLSGLWGLYWLMFSFSIPLGCCFEPGLWPSCPFIESLFLLPYCRHRSAVVFPPSVQFELLLPARTTAESSAAVEQLQTTEPKLLRVGVMSRQGSQWGCSWGIGRGPGWGRPAPEWGKGIHWG